MLKNAGAVIMGKTVTVEFANYGPGPTRNPNNLEHTPGGSSSGSAAAVASGLCPLALGTQTAGSVIRPAAYCGIVGFKPTFERISTSGVIPLAPSLDTLGYYTSDVAGAEFAASIMVDQWQPKKHESNPVLGIPNGSYLERADMSALLHFHGICDQFRNAGLKLKSINLFEDIKALEKMHDSICDAEFAGVHDPWFKAYGARYSEGNSQAIFRGQKISPQRLGIARNNRRLLREHIMQAMQKKRLTALIAPAAPGPAPKGLHSTGDWIMNLPWTHAGLPVVNLPLGSSQGRLPLGLQLIGHYSGDEALLSLAGTLENLLKEI
jgi:Asp-tRNA(Asn)/Glu-tRNA(Gln) amidotransferase A subunit family amidase